MGPACTHGSCLFESCTTFRAVVHCSMHVCCTRPASVPPPAATCAVACIHVTNLPRHLPACLQVHMRPLRVQILLQEVLHCPQRDPLPQVHFLMRDDRMAITLPLSLPCGHRSGVLPLHGGDPMHSYQHDCSRAAPRSLLSARGTQFTERRACVLTPAAAALLLLA